MFDRGKKGASAKEPAREEQRPEPTSVAPPPAAQPKRPAGQREAAVIGPSIHIDGDLRGEEDLLIEGEVNGTVQLKSNSLTIGSQGKVRADVYAHTIYVEGLMEGDLYGSERVVIRRTAQVKGNVTSPRVSLDEGARFKGTIEMDGDKAQRAAAPKGVQQPGGEKPPLSAAGGDAGAKRGAAS
jgi:cytoskeletal protein CcmA (bactofilin family)